MKQYRRNQASNTPRVIRGSRTRGREVWPCVRCFFWCGDGFCLHRSLRLLKFPRSQPPKTPFISIMSRKCSICHLPGHDHRTCPNVRAKSPISAQDSKDDSLTSNIESFEASASSPIASIPESPETPAPQQNSKQLSPDTAALAEEIAADLEVDQELLESVMDFSLNSTDDSKDEDYQPPSPSPKSKNDAKKAKASQKQKQKKTQKSTKISPQKPLSGPPVRVHAPGSKKTPPQEKINKNQKTAGNSYFDKRNAPPLIPGVENAQAKQAQLRSPPPYRISLDTTILAPADSSLGTLEHNHARLASNNLH